MEALPETLLYVELREIVSISFLVYNEIGNQVRYYSDYNVTIYNFLKDK